MPVLAATSRDVDVVVVRAAIARAGRLLLVRRAAWDSLPGHWELPGGKAGDEEPLEPALLRELSEETALTAAGAPDFWFELPVLSPSGRSVAERVYRLPTAGVPELSAEHDDLVWLDPATEAPGPLTLTAAAALRRSHPRRRARG
jgi:8-oxo-dGTP pyrophosphatase MutT (NUDIX family)